MRGVLRKWTQRDKYFKYKNFPTYFRLSLLPECFGEIMTTIRQIFIHYKIGQSGCIPPKIKCEILADKGSQIKQLAPRQEIISPRETANQWDNGTSWHQ